MQKAIVSRLIYFEAFFLSFTSCIIGIALGITILFCISRIRWPLDSDFSLFLNGSYMSFEINGLLMSVHAILVVAFTMFAVGFPARKAARLSPATAFAKQT